MKSDEASQKTTSQNTYRYYLLGDTVPVRIIVSPSGGWLGAEAPDRTTGELTIQDLVSRIETSWEVEEIVKVDFDSRCRQIRGEKLNQTKPRLAHD